MKPTDAQLMAMNREQLAACYLEWIGYDPFEGSPSTTTDEVRQILVEYFAEMENSQ